MNKKKHVFITGVSRGIGRATALLFVKNGYQVTGTSRNPSELRDPIKGIRYISLDLKKPETITSRVNQSGNIDILINNAGQSQIGPAEEIPFEKFIEMFQINLFGLVRLSNHIIAQMRQKRKGQIINIGSLVGKFAIPFQASYVASKWALAGYTWSLRNELRYFGIKVSLVEPIDTKTSIKPEEFINENSEYQSNYLKVKDCINDKMKHAVEPEKVAKKILKIARAKNPKPCYSVGGRGPLLVFLSRFVSNKNIESLLIKNYKLK
ncbi:MAG: SDR family NAD(P)-dependent oxidoreductase [Candidatus Aminicenantaceae bacterium]